MQHDEDDDCNDEDIEEAREAMEHGLTAGGNGMEDLLAGLGSNEDANLLDIGNGTESDGQPPATLGDLLGEGGAGRQSRPSARKGESEAGATADLLGL